MGIKQLSAYLKKHASATMQDWHCANEYKGKTVAIDASPCLYQCLTAMGDTPAGVVPGSEDDKSHVMGFFRRTVRILELGIKPIFVFDGEAPEMKKQGAHVKREKMRTQSREQLDEAQAAGDEDAVKRHSARLVKIQQRHNDETMELLRLMGVACVEAPGEAECLAAALVTAGRADAAATEDMDALPFGATRLLRNLHRAVASPQVPLIQDIYLPSVLEGLSLTHTEFVDLCILAGCDYLGTIAKVGIVNAHKLMKKHRSIDQILEHLDTKKHTVPDDWDFQAARNCFLSPDLGDIKGLKLAAKPPEVTDLRALLVERHSLPAHAVDEFIKRLVAVAGCAKPPLFNPPAATSGAAQSMAPAVPTAPAAPAEPAAPVAVAPASVFRKSAPVVAQSRSVATPARQAARAPAVHELPKGQKTLAAAFAGAKRPAASFEDSPRKRRRKEAMEVIESVLGKDVAVSQSTLLEDLERLAADLGSASVGFEATDSHSGGIGICCVGDD